MIQYNLSLIEMFRVSSIQQCKISMTHSWRSNLNILRIFHYRVISVGKAILIIVIHIERVVLIYLNYKWVKEGLNLMMIYYNSYNHKRRNLLMLRYKRIRNNSYRILVKNWIKRYNHYNRQLINWLNRLIYQLCLNRNRVKERNRLKIKSYWMKSIVKWGNYTILIKRRSTSWSLIK